MHNADADAEADADDDGALHKYFAQGMQNDFC